MWKTQTMFPKVKEMKTEIMIVKSNLHMYDGLTKTIAEL
jgi:hypothetical protein